MRIRQELAIESPNPARATKGRPYRHLQLPEEKPALASQVLVLFFPVIPVAEEFYKALIPQDLQLLAYFRTNVVILRMPSLKLLFK